ncbi:hypothetical protein TrLO_g8747 [Triparma laevis f. longispina]|uniref:Uncharacterized protein n=1 Tax=Triparma laevis f. longispina TaxID=1714387 RepID=A0A9W7A4Z6_9STRA|nr:hypothetical protein TrLO_g8747 [Triparma laevis f. longispina]
MIITLTHIYHNNVVVLKTNSECFNVCGEGWFCNGRIFWRLEGEEFRVSGSGDLKFVKDGVGIFARSGKYHVRDIGGEKVDVKGVEDFLGVGEIYEKKEEDLGKKMLEDLLKGGEVEEEKQKVGGEKGENGNLAVYLRFGDETATSLVDREGVVITCVGDFEETTNSKVDEGDGNKVAMLKDFKGRLERRKFKVKIKKGGLGGGGGVPKLGGGGKLAPKLGAKLGGGGGVPKLGAKAVPKLGAKAVPKLGAKLPPKTPDPLKTPERDHNVESESALPPPAPAPVSPTPPPITLTLTHTLPPLSSSLGLSAAALLLKSSFPPTLTLTACKSNKCALASPILGSNLLPIGAEVCRVSGRRDDGVLLLGLKVRRGATSERVGV